MNTDIENIVSKGRGEALIRIAIVNADRCKPNKCNHECIKYNSVIFSYFVLVNISYFIENILF